MSEDLSTYLKFAKIWNAHRTYPVIHDLENALDMPMKKIRRFVDKYNQMREKHPKLPELIWRREATGQAIPVPPGALKQLEPFRMDLERLKNAEGFVVTSAQFGANLHKQFWGALQVYAEYRDFPLVVMPIKYGPIQYINGRFTSTFPNELKGHLIFEDVILGNGSLQLNVARMRPTLDRFLTDKICEKGGNTSQIFAAPAMELEHRPRPNHAYPKACMTTGAATIPSYVMDKLGQQDRTAELATDAHTYAAIVVEFDGKAFHFRQLIADKKGQFYDIDPIHGGARWFTHKGHEHRPNAVEGLVLGDWHTGKTCPKIRAKTFGKGGMVDTLQPDNIVLHDFVDGDSVSHYEAYQAHRRAWKGPKQYDSMELELIRATDELHWMQKQAPNSKLHVVASNHPEFISKYIDEMKWTKDDINLAFGARMFSLMVGDLEQRNPRKVDAIACDPVVMYLRKFCPDVNVMNRTDKLLLGNKTVMCSMHGDIGPMGVPSRGLVAFRKMNISLTFGHNHTGTIWGNLWRVGVSTPRTQFYVTTPSTAWTNTHGPIFDNGQRMLLNIVNGRWHGQHAKPQRKVKA
jgi:hypothetical protein